MGPKSKLTPRVFILLLLVWATGGQWMALQSVAWGGMLCRFSRTDGLTAALAKTFDGDHLCGLCRFIQAQQKQPDRQDRKALLQSAKVPLYFVVFAALGFVLLSLGRLGFTRTAWLNWRPAPLSPPPRTA